MPTPAEEAFAEGFSELADVHGKSWTFGGSSFAGVASALRSDDPRMEGSADRLFEVVALTDDLPSPAPKRGDEITQGSKTYRVTRRPDAEPSTGLTTLVVVEA